MFPSPGRAFAEMKLKYVLEVGAAAGENCERVETRPARVRVFPNDKIH